MGEYPIGAMDDVKRDKAKRSKQDQVSQAVSGYLQRRNYPPTAVPSEVSAEELRVEALVDREASRPNAVAYNCYNSDPNVIDQNYLKFVSWLRDVGKTKDHDDLTYIVGPLFCHLYLEMLQRGHSEKASNFLKAHAHAIDRSKCDDVIVKLLHMFSNDMSDINGIKKKFRANKYCVELRPDSLERLKKFLESCHLVMLQVFQTCFEINVKVKHEIDEQIPDRLENGIENHSNPALERLKNAVSALKTDTTLVHSVTLKNLKEDVSCGLINRESGIAAYSYHSSVFLKPLRTLKQLEGTDEINDIVFREHRKRIYDISYIPKHNLLVTASQDTTLRLFDLETYTQKLIYNSHNYAAYCVATTSNYVASGSYDHTARLWSIENNNVLRVYAGHTQEVTSVAFHPNGLYLCSGSADKCVRMWTVGDANPVRLLVGSRGAVYATAFASRGRYLASAGDDRRLRVWDLTGGRQLFELRVGPEPVVRLRWNDDDTALCAGTADGVVRTWDVSGGGAAAVVSDSGQGGGARANVNLNAKLLDVEYSMGSFGCLTAKMANSSPL